MGLRSIPLLIRSLYAHSLDLLFPPRCVTCGKLGEVCCRECISQVALIREPYCNCCGSPGAKEYDCIHCNTWHYNFDQARAWGRYSGILRKTILSLKHRYNSQLGSELSKFLTIVLSAQRWTIDVVVPIPLAPHRLAERGYNQAEILAKPLATSNRLNFANNLLQRSHETVKQFELGAQERWVNLLGAFQVKGHGLEGANVLMIDDIMTTGATLNAAAVSLKKAGCSRVYALTLARTLFDEE